MESFEIVNSLKLALPPEVMSAFVCKCVHPFICDRYLPDGYMFHIDAKTGGNAAVKHDIQLMLVTLMRLAGLGLAPDHDKHQFYIFKLLDDDKNIYFEGIMLGNADLDLFKPLDTYGVSFGCTELKLYSFEDNCFETL